LFRDIEKRSDRPKSWRQAEVLFSKANTDSRRFIEHETKTRLENKRRGEAKQ
jgi:hypothetical protein